MSHLPLMRSQPLYNNSTGGDLSYTDQVRTPLVVVIKTITTHAFALGTYAYASNLLRRPTRSHIQALRMLFHLFVPTLPLIELLVSALRALVQFLRNYEDDDETHARYYLSGALGMHANLSQDDDEGKKEVGKNSSKNMHLLNVGSTFAEKTVLAFDWVWVGKMLAALFGLTQAVGTIVMWVRRMNTWEAKSLSFDHRNGAMGVASAICSTVCILVIILRLRWKVSKSFEGNGQEGERGFWLGMEQKSLLVAEMMLSMLLHLSIAAAANSDNLWLYSSVGSVAFLFAGGPNIMLQGWQTLVLIIFIYIFRHDISQRLGINHERFLQRFGGKRWKRAKALFGVLLMGWIMLDVVWLFVVDVLQVVQESKEGRHGGYLYGYIGYWWQDPLSDSLIVI